MPFVRPARPLLRGALVGGTAYAAGKRATRGQQQEMEQEEATREPQAQQAQQAQQQAAPCAPADTSGGLEELDRLAELRSKGLLNEAEFTAAKARLLGL